MASTMKTSLPHGTLICWGAAFLVCILHCVHLSSAQATLPNCTFPALYSFGDSLTDTGNAIGAFPAQFANAELPPHGIQFPMHAADRYCDGKLFVDFLAFGVRLRPIYPVLRGTAGDFTWGTNFAVAGATARNSTVWRKNAGFNTPFSLEVQMQWLQRYKVRVWFYENYPSATYKQTLPKLSTLNASLYMVYAGYQDYFYSLYDKTLTPRQALALVPEVVDAIATHVESLILFETYNILVVNLPPLGCMPAMLAMYGENDTSAKYNSYGCLTDLNAITSAHNQLLGEKVVYLRAKYPAVKLLYGDAHGVYTDILKSPVKYNVTVPLKACCGYGGSYNFNTEVTCGHTGMVGGTLVNLTATPCVNPTNHLSWDGIHVSNTFNMAAVTDFLSGKHISPAGGFGCSPDFTMWDAKM